MRYDVFNATGAQEDLILLLHCWKEAFNTLLPSVFFTDEDSAMGSALISLPRCDHVSHMLCCYHIFDTNVKKKVQQALLHGASSWPQFRRGLSVCRKAVTEEEFHSQWNQLLELHLKRSNRTKMHGTTCRTIFTAKERNGRLHIIWSRERLEHLPLNVRRLGIALLSHLKPRMT